MEEKKEKSPEKKKVKESKQDKFFSLAEGFVDKSYIEMAKENIHSRERWSRGFCRIGNFPSQAGTIKWLNTF